jgi:hypothetical protein
MRLSTGLAYVWLGISLVYASPIVHLADELVKGKSASYGKHGAVATEVKLCSDLGVQLLKKGGNAADAVSLSSLLRFHLFFLIECWWGLRLDDWSSALCGHGCCVPFWDWGWYEILHLFD